MRPPLVLAFISDDAVAAGLAAGFEEEGVPLTVLSAQGTPAALARQAANQTVLGIGIGGGADRLALVLSGAPARPYLEAQAAEARSFGGDAARIAARRPLRSGTRP
jgi:Dehydratase medium subunit